VVGATIQILLPGPVVLEGDELVEVGAGVDHALLVDAHAGGFAFQFVEAFAHVQFVQRALGAGDGVGVVSGNGAGFFHGTGGFVVQLGGGLACRLRGSGGRRGGGGVFFVEFVPAQHVRLLLIGDRGLAGRMYLGGFWFARKSAELLVIPDRGSGRHGGCAKRHPPYESAPLGARAELGE